MMARIWKSGITSEGAVARHQRDITLGMRVRANVDQSCRQEGCALRVPVLSPVCTDERCFCLSCHQQDRALACSFLFVSEELHS